MDAMCWLFSSIFRFVFFFSYNLLGSSVLVQKSWLSVTQPDSCKHIASWIFHCEYKCMQIHEILQIEQRQIYYISYPKHIGGKTQCETMYHLKWGQSAAMMELALYRQRCGLGHLYACKQYTDHRQRLLRSTRKLLFSPQIAGFIFEQWIRFEKLNGSIESEQLTVGERGHTSIQQVYPRGQIWAFAFLLPAHFAGIAEHKSRRCRAKRWSSTIYWKSNNGIGAAAGKNANFILFDDVFTLTQRNYWPPMTACLPWTNIGPMYTRTSFWLDLNVFGQTSISPDMYV